MLSHTLLFAYAHTVPGSRSLKTASDNKIAKELQSYFNKYKYTEYCSYLNDSDAVSSEYFQGSVLSETYWVDVRSCFVNNVINCNHVLELFCKYSETEPNELRAEVLREVKSEKDIWDHIGHVELAMRAVTIDEWITCMELQRTQCDELMLYMLKRIHCRHSVVYTMKHSWTTVSSDDYSTEVDLYNKCDTKLV